MSAFDGYKPEHRSISPGDYWCEIVETSDQPSKTGKPMITITVRLAKANIRIKEYFVAGTEFFNSKLTAFYECFSIALGNDEIMSWVGAIGVVRLKEDKDNPEYLRIARFLNAESEEAKKLGPWEGPKPEQQTVSQLRSDAASPEDDDELPF